MFEKDYDDTAREYQLFISHNGEGDEEYKTKYSLSYDFMFYTHPLES